MDLVFNDINSNYYLTNLRTFKGIIKLTPGVYAIPDRDAQDVNSFGIINTYGNLPKRYVIISKTGENAFNCTCKENPIIADRECIHIACCKDIVQDIDIVDEALLRQNRLYPSPPAVQEGSNLETAKLCGVYNFDLKSFGVLRVTTHTTVCLCCKNTACGHRRVYRLINEPHYIHRPMTFPSVTKHEIEYPLSIESASVLREYNSGTRRYPKFLIPKYSRSTKCIHGHRFQHQSPIANNWLSARKSYIHLLDSTFSVKVYFRPVVLNIDNCDCKQEFEGLNECLFNYNNTHIFSYELMITIMHHILVGKMPLSATVNSINRTRTFMRAHPFKRGMANIIRLAYNAFVRLTDIVKNPQSKVCNKCPVGRIPDCVIMDGTTLGCRIDRMDHNMFMPNDNLIPIDEVPNCTKIFLPLKETREHVQRFYNNQVQDGDEADLERVIDSMPYDSIKQLLRDAEPGPCPPELYTFFKSISAGNTAAGIFQHGGDNAMTARNILLEVINGDFSRVNNEDLNKYTPLLVDILRAGYLIPSDTISEVIQDIVTAIEVPFSGVDPALDPQQPRYTEPCVEEEMPLDKFSPHLTLCKGKGKYEADSRGLPRREDERILCKKYLSKQHPMLSPGVFLLVCQHGFCHGFTMMDKHESPRIPFDILTTRFPTPPKTVVYDNACKLHQMVLKREPLRFKNTKFLVDRFHSKGHTCSRGYHMDTYKKDEIIATINSQLCEQLNARLKNLRGQIACMSSDNAKFHIELFLSIRNVDINKSNA